MRFWTVALFLALTVGGSCVDAAAAEGDEVIPHRQDHAPNKPYSPQEALARMTVPDRFHVDLVASEPEIVNPIAMTFDDRGRIFITQSVEYPRKAAGPGRDRVTIIEGIDAKGRATNVSVFAEGLNIPTGVAVGYGGVWVLNAPDLLFLREKDGKEISREVVLSGFGRTDTHELPNSLTWGPDGWLYGLNGVFNQCHVISRDGKPHDFTCAMWRLHPRTREFQVFAQGTSNPYGVAWDADGSAIIEACHWANDHLFHFVETGYYTRQAGAYPPFTMKIGSITDHGHQKTAYCGIVNLDTDLFPAAYRQRICVGNIHGDCINVDRLQRDGATYLAKGEPDLLTANDAWFMPVSLKIGPDGCLYILDWHDRYHCSQDAARDPDGVDRLRGRLYRLRYGEAPAPKQIDLGAQSDERLISRLANGNLYFRETAQRVLAERAAGSDALRSALQRHVLEESVPRPARLHALWALIGGGVLDPSFHEKLLSHADPAFRAWAIRAAGNEAQVAPALRDAVIRLARDPSPDVLLQVAIASRKIDGLDALSVLVDVLTHCGHDKLIPTIVWSNLHPLLETDSERMVSLLKTATQPFAGARPSEGLPPAVAALLPRMIDRILAARSPNTPAVSSLIRFAMQNDSDLVPDCIVAVSARITGLSDAALAQLKQQLAPLIETTLKDGGNAPLQLSTQLLAARLNLTATAAAADVRRKFTSSDEPQTTRLQALEALIAFRDASLVDSLPQVLGSASPSLATRILTALGHIDDPKLADILLAQYPKLAPELQPVAIDLLMQRETWAQKLLSAVLAGTLPKSALSANHLRKILESNDREALWAVERAFGKVREERNPQREKVVAEMGEFLRGNIGDPVAGQRVFKNFCGQCHTIYGDGGKVGPDITANGRASFDQLLSNVFDPSLVIGPAYQVTTVVTKDGRNLTGLIAEDNEQRIVIRMIGEGEEAIPRNNVKYTRVSKLSMMPEGIETQLEKKDLADLFAFLCLDKPPGNPAAKLIPGAPTPPAARPADDDRRIKVERTDGRLDIRARLPRQKQWIDLASFVMNADSRPHLHPVRDPSGKVILTEDKPADHPWQHGIFTGFHLVNGFNYWKEDQGRQHFVQLLDLKEAADLVSWRALVELKAPDGEIVLEEEDAIRIHAPESADAYLIDFDLLLRARDRNVNFGKFFVGGLSVRMPWDKANPRQTHLNSEGKRNRDCEQQRAKWCNVERPFADETLGIAILDHPDNPNHPCGWRADEQGLINPNISSQGDWSIAALKEQSFKYRLVVYRGSATSEQLAARFEAFAREARESKPQDAPADKRRNRQ
jgi:putative heme-binding domain-containing protein